ncbi:thiolase family protein [Parafrankia elaeagni]|uniref:thiolase family protein n=1 Tax=Parafrankia elaeagni TaxID=222534 RepID=UPI000367342A|nr:thiolase family protein [Parafrankia elaeagni]
MAEAVIIDAVRSPMGKGKPGGALSSLHAVDLLAQVLQALVNRSGLDPGLVEDVLIGCVSQGGEQAACPGRMAWLAAGFPDHVPAVTIDRRCGSSQQAAHFAAHGVAAGAYDIVIAGGIESMSRVPMGSARMGADPYGPLVNERYAPGLVPQGVAAELVTARWKLGREDLDAYAVASHARASAAAADGHFDREIVPVTVRTEAGLRMVTTDETIRPGTTVERLGKLKPSFESEAMSARFPEISWSVTAGNSSQLTDGASALLIMSAERAASLGLRPRARFHSYAVCGDDPVSMLTGPIPATRKILARSGLSIDDIDHVEVNEAFASVPLAWAAEFGVDLSRVNPRGGAIALGHPLGASGTRLMTTMLGALEDTGGRYGLQTMCEAGGMANATIIERL